MDHIQIKDHTFLISTNDTSYMFRVNKYGHLEHLHYGGRVTMKDEMALA